MVRKLSTVRYLIYNFELNFLATQHQLCFKSQKKKTGSVSVIFFRNLILFSYWSTGFPYFHKCQVAACHFDHSRSALILKAS
jgi:hypothetical protein